MNDDLDQKTTAQLSEIFAVECAGFHRIPYAPSGVLWKDREGAVAQERHVHRLAESFDAVLPHLEKHPECVIMRSDTTRMRWFVGLGSDSKAAEGDTLAVAGAKALIRAKRAEKGSA